MYMKSVAKAKPTFFTKIDKHSAVFCDGLGVDALGHELNFPTRNFVEPQTHHSKSLHKVVMSRDNELELIVASLLNPLAEDVAGLTAGFLVALDPSGIDTAFLGRGVVKLRTERSQITSYS